MKPNKQYGVIKKTYSNDLLQVVKTIYINESLAEVEQPQKYNFDVATQIMRDARKQNTNKNVSVFLVEF